jgi:hypothetical protein
MLCYKLKVFPTKHFAAQENVMGNETFSRKQKLSRGSVLPYFAKSRYFLYVSLFAKNIHKDFCFNPIVHIPWHCSMGAVEES